MTSFKVMAFSLMLAFSGLVLCKANAGDKEDADSLFASREFDNKEGVEKALKAALLYEKVKLYTKAAEAFYFYADNSSNNDLKITYFLKGADDALLGAKEFEKEPGKAKNPSMNEQLAISYYWYGACKARWAEANGVLNSLAQWPTVKKYMNFIREDLGQKEVISYGANRVLGKAYMKLPWPMGDKKLSYDLLKEAFDNTSAMDPDGISNYGINILFYSEILIDRGEKDYAKDILSLLVEKEKDLASYNPDRIPESKKEIKEAKEKLKNL